MFDWVLNTPLVLNIKCNTVVLKKSRKIGPRTFRKSGPYAKIRCIGHLYDKLEVADLKYGIDFSDLNPKTTQLRHFWFLV